MKMIEYYLHLVNKPRYTLSTAEQAYIDLFPYIITAAIIIAFALGWHIITAIVKWWKKK